MVKIVPAILAKTKEDFLSQVNIAQDFSNLLQIDYMDGDFVNNRTALLSEILSVPIKAKKEIHLMMKNPETVFAKLKNFETVYVHFEAVENMDNILKAAEKNNLNVGIAINPETDLMQIASHLMEIKNVLIMGVKAGASGQQLIPETIDKAKQLASEFPFIKVSFDGGINDENISLLKGSGIESVTVHSSIFEKKDPEQAYNNLIAAIK